MLQSEIVETLTSIINGAFDGDIAVDSLTLERIINIRDRINEEGVQWG